MKDQSLNDCSARARVRFFFLFFFWVINYVVVAAAGSPGVIREAKNLTAYLRNICTTIVLCLNCACLSFLNKRCAQIRLKLKNAISHCRLAAPHANQRVNSVS